MEYLLVQKYMQNALSHKGLLFLWTFSLSPNRAMLLSGRLVLQPPFLWRCPGKCWFFFTPFWMQSDWVFFSYSKIDKIPYKDYTIDSIFFIPVIFRKMFSINLSGKYKKYMDWILIFMISFIISCKLYYKTLLLSCLKILVLVFFFKSLNCYKIKLMSISVCSAKKNTTPMQSENNHFIFETVGNKSQNSQSAFVSNPHDRWFGEIQWIDNIFPKRRSTITIFQINIVSSFDDKMIMKHSYLLWAFCLDLNFANCAISHSIKYTKLRRKIMEYL